MLGNLAFNFINFTGCNRQKFLFDFSEWLGLGVDPRMSEWLSFVLILPLGFGVSFQLPLVMLFLGTALRRWVLSLSVFFLEAVVVLTGVFAAPLLGGGGDTLLPGGGDVRAPAGPGASA